MLRRSLSGAVVAALLFTPKAHAQFAAPPDQYDLTLPAAAAGEARRSRAVFHLGPALDLVDAEPGLFAALDIGEAAGVRISGSFVGVGRPGGASVAAVELWLSPLELGRVRPVVAAGAGFRDAIRRGAPELEHDRAGLALVRGGFEVLLPTSRVDARAAVAVVGHLPAIVEGADPDPRASVLIVSSLALGF